MKPERVILWMITVGLYLAVTIKLFTGTVPELLREANSATNGAGIMAAACWLLITLYIVLKWLERRTKKGTKNEDS